MHLAELVANTQAFNEERIRMLYTKKVSLLNLSSSLTLAALAIVASSGFAITGCQKGGTRFSLVDHSEAEAQAAQLKASQELEAKVIDTFTAFSVEKQRQILPVMQDLQTRNRSILDGVSQILESIKRNDVRPPISTDELSRLYNELNRSYSERSGAFDHFLSPNGWLDQNAGQINRWGIDLSENFRTEIEGYRQAAETLANPFTKEEFNSIISSINQIQTDQVSASNAIAALEGLLAKALEEAKVANQEILRLQAEISHLNDRNAVLEGVNADLIKGSNEQSGRIADLEAALRVVEEEKKGLEERKKEQERDIAIIEGELSDRTEDLNQARNDNNQQKEDLQQIQDNIVQLNNRIAAITTQIITLKNTIEKVETIKTDSTIGNTPENILPGMNSAVETLISRLNAAKEEGEKVPGLNTQISNLENELKEAEEEIQRADDRADQAEAALAVAQDNLPGLRDQLSAKEAELTQLEAERNNLGTKLELAEVGNADLSAKLKDKIAELNQANSELKEVSERESNLQNQLNHLKARMAGLTVKLDAFSRQELGSDGVGNGKSKALLKIGSQYEAVRINENYFALGFEICNRSAQFSTGQKGILPLGVGEDSTTCLSDSDPEWVGHISGNPLDAPSSSKLIEIHFLPRFLNKSFGDSFRVRIPLPRAAAWNEQNPGSLLNFNIKYNEASRELGVHYKYRSLTSNGQSKDVEQYLVYSLTIGSDNRIKAISTAVDQFQLRPAFIDSKLAVRSVRFTDFDSMYFQRQEFGNIMMISTSFPELPTQP